MPRDPDKYSDHAADGVSLAAEAALLEARLRLLQEAIDTVDARINAVSDTLRLLHRTSSVPSEAADSEEPRGSGGRDTGDRLTDDARQSDH
jgi:hypothetical protein